MSLIGWNYGISAKREEDGIITEVFIHPIFQDGHVGEGYIWSKEDVISHIDDRNKVTTILPTGDGGWRKGAEVHVVDTGSGRYIRTDKNETPRDNLGELPEF
ncbi:DUF3892 domain-containing protein [Candidatus Parcubacteria bacterium]|nr:DUF3892 domain-containing protein [Candidatus Parcubacteria bacterium]